MIPDGPPDVRRAYIEGLYQAYASGDPSRTLAVMDDAIDFEYVAPASVFGFAGKRTGKAAALAAMGEVAAVYAIDFLAVKSVMLDGDEVSVRMEAGFTERATGVKFETTLVDVAEIRGGKIVRLKEYFDADTVALQLFGQTPSLSLSPAST